MSVHAASTVLMVRPAAFGYNDQTAVNNHFQNKATQNLSALTESAVREFNAMVTLLEQNGIEVIVVDDNANPPRPDAIFPNNWFSCKNNRLTVFPMYAENRRLEKREDIITMLHKRNPQLVLENLSKYETENRFLEGTGSIVCDHHNKIMYACISERTDAELVKYHANASGYEAVCFKATDSSGREIYHTNVMMSVGEGFAIICLNAIANINERDLVAERLVSGGNEIIAIDQEQVLHFTGNLLQLKNRRNESYLLMSSTACKSLTSHQLSSIKKYAAPLVADISTIERTGGGSVRCMVAEIFE